MVAIPEGVTVEISGRDVTARGPKGSVTRRFSAIIKIEKKDNEIVVEGSEKEKAYLGTVESLLNSMFTGVTAGFQKSLKVLYSHFPVTLEAKGDRVLIKNFIGEKHPRKARIMGDSKVEVKGQSITVSGPDKEAVGQTIANLKSAMKIGKKDPRVFQDGIFEVME
jgi:large subunit ribosomal protein L6